MDEEKQELEQRAKRLKGAIPSLLLQQPLVREALSILDGYQKLTQRCQHAKADK